MVDIDNEILRREEVALLNKSITSIKQDRDLLATHFAQGSDIVPFLNTIESIARKSGVKAEISSVDVLKDKSGLLVKVSSSGTFNNIYKFLLLLENSPYELDVSGLNLQKEPSAVVSDESGIEGVEPAPVVEPKWQALFTLKLLSFVP